MSNYLSRLFSVLFRFTFFCSQDKQAGFALEAKPQTPLGLYQTSANVSRLHIKHFIKRFVRMITEEK